MTRLEIQNMIQNLRTQAEELKIELDAMPFVADDEELVPIEIIEVLEERVPEIPQLRFSKI